MRKFSFSKLSNLYLCMGCMFVGDNNIRDSDNFWMIENDIFVDLRIESYSNVQMNDLSWMAKLKTKELPTLCKN